MAGSSQRACVDEVMVLVWARGRNDVGAWIVSPCSKSKPRTVSRGNTMEQSTAKRHSGAQS
jgi:hypothetical protein